jgi:putative ABC transport system substrate-binding protein
LGRQVRVVTATNEREIEAAFSVLIEAKAGAVAVAANPFLNSRRSQVVALAERHAIPAIYEYRQAPEIGGLVSYGPSVPDVYRQVGVYAGRILNGEKPADLPVVQPAKFELLINLKTAKALGLEVPPTVLARADEVIE